MAVSKLMKDCLLDSCSAFVASPLAHKRAFPGSAVGLGESEQRVALNVRQGSHREAPPRQNQSDQDREDRGDADDLP